MNKIEAKNLSAQLRHRAAGNPPSSEPDSAISNCFPGLETDFRNVWKHILRGIELHESSNLVVRVEQDADPSLKKLATGYRLLTVEGIPMTVAVKGPKTLGGPTEPLTDTGFGENTMPLEWSNALADLVNREQRTVRCRFQSIKDPNDSPEFSLELRNFFERKEVLGEVVKTAVINAELAAPGELTQSLCSPWQNDYRECACFYWAASRPDYVNVEARPDGTSDGNNWMEKERTQTAPKTYIVDDRTDPRLISYRDLFVGWERVLKFEFDGKDEE
jgi:L-lysine epsilon oxidase-like protein